MDELLLEEPVVKEGGYPSEYHRPNNRAWDARFPATEELPKDCTHEDCEWPAPQDPDTRQRGILSKQAPPRSRIPEWLQKHAGLEAASVHAFCLERGILGHAETALGLAKQEFASDNIRLEIQSDPDGEGQWLVIEVDVQGNIEAVLGAYRRYKDRLTELVPWPQRSLVRTLYNIV